MQQFTLLLLLLPRCFAITLNSSTFNAALLTAPAAAIEFYMTKCRHCKSFAPKWKAFAALVEAKYANDHVLVGEVDCGVEMNAAMCASYGAEKLPFVLGGNALDLDRAYTTTTTYSAFIDDDDLDDANSNLFNWFETRVFNEADHSELLCNIAEPDKTCVNDATKHQIKRLDSRTVTPSALKAEASLAAAMVARARARFSAAKAALNVKFDELNSARSAPTHISKRAASRNSEIRLRSAVVAMKAKKKKKKKKVTSKCPDPECAHGRMCLCRCEPQNKKLCSDEVKAQIEAIEMLPDDELAALVAEDKRVVDAEKKVYKAGVKLLNTELKELRAKLRADLSEFTSELDVRVMLAVASKWTGNRPAEPFVPPRWVGDEL